MEPITHFLTGACIGRAGLNRKTAYATLAAVLAAEAADIDVFWGLAGPVEELKHHRGITHTFVAVPVVAAAAVGLVWLIDRGVRAWRKRKSAVGSDPNERTPVGVSGFPPIPQKDAERMGHPAGSAPNERTPVEVRGLPPIRKEREWMGHPVQDLLARQKIRWGWLYLTALISAMSHLMLDWTNNYGLRPFFPFNPRWYAGDLVFIAEPVIWALLAAALLIPALLGLVSGEIGARRTPFRGRGWAIFALTGIVLLWGWRWAEHGRARMLVENAQIASAPVKRMAFEPYPINPFRWHAILETDAYYQTAEINTRTGEIVSDPQADVIYKPRETAATLAAKRTLLGQVYLDWGTWAVVRDVGPEPAPGMEPPRLPPNRVWTTVEFTDLRFAYPFLGPGAEKNRNQPPLSGWVYIVDSREEAGEAMAGRQQR
jgi:inner membrane protein